jgi:hypothetical protein
LQYLKVFLLKPLKTRRLFAFMPAKKYFCCSTCSCFCFQYVKDRFLVSREKDFYFLPLIIV